MKRILLALTLTLTFALCLLLSSCGFLTRGGKGAGELSLPKTVNRTIYGETHTDQFFHDKVIKREDGFYEVFSRRLTDDSGDVANIRYLFTSDGTPLGSRTNSSDASDDDWIELYETSLESCEEAYAAAGMLDHQEGNRLYLTNGGYDDLETDGDRVLHIRSYNVYGNLVVEIKLNAHGQTELFCLYDDNGDAYVTIRTTYQTIKP